MAALIYLAIALIAGWCGFIEGFSTHGDVFKFVSIVFFLIFLVSVIAGFRQGGSVRE